MSVAARRGWALWPGAAKTETAKTVKTETYLACINVFWFAETNEFSNI